MDKPPSMPRREKEPNRPSPEMWVKMQSLAEANNFDAIFDLIDENDLELDKTQRDFLNEKQDALKLEPFQKQLETETTLTFWKGATMNDLFNRLDITNEEMDDAFFAELAHRFDDPGFVAAFYSHGRPRDLIGVMKIFDFFKLHGYNEEYLLNNLPIEFSDR